VCENREEATGELRKFRDELHNLFPSRDVVQMIKSRRLRWKGNSHAIGNKEFIQSLENIKERNTSTF
jgi:hypothetical protein